MKDNLLNLVKQCTIFSSLDDAALKQLIKKFDKISLKKNKILFRQGELSNDLYLLISGKIRLILKTERNEKKIINEIKSGEIVGELSSLTHVPRSATAKTLEDCILFRLSTDTFREICQKHPAVSLETINTFIARSQNLLKILSEEEPERKHIAILPANKKVNLNIIFDKISNEIQQISTITLLSDETSEFQVQPNIPLILNQLIDDLEKKNKTIFYFIKSPKSPLAKFCFEKADIIYLVGRGGFKPFINNFILKKINNLILLKKAKPELILIHEKKNQLPHHTSKWLHLAPFRLHHHIRIHQDKDWQRLLRFMRRKAIGLVLGGGGLRCWAHLGAIRALHEAGIPIDMIGGTSAGAIVAGYYALHETYRESPQALHELSEITSKTVSLRNMTWPAISIFDSKNYTKKLISIFGKTRIENLWLPCFSVACKLSDNTQVIHRRGLLWKIIRSSTAVPAVFPPVVIKGKLHLDGGILNNLPVDVMKKLISNKGKVIAVELTHYSKDDTEYHFPPILNFWQTLLAKLGIAHKDYHFPPFVDTFLKSLLAGSSAKQTENSLAADLLVKPDLSSFSLLNVSKKQEDELIKLGYDATVEALKRWK